jgi:macrolide transport system ATP-binding/permease protein
MLQRFRSFFRRRKLDTELDEELRFHLEERIRENIAAGMPPGQARRAARLAFGNPVLAKEDTREVWTLGAIERFWQDVRYAARSLLKSPSFTLVAVVTLALGIGANTAVFSLIDAVMLRTLPVRDPQRLVVFRWKAHHDPLYHGFINYGDCGPGGGGSGCSFSVPLFEAMRAQAKSFSGLTAFAGPMPLNLSGNGPASVAHGEFVSGEFFSTLDVGTTLGRPLGPADDSPTAPPAIVLSYSYWERAFGGDRSALGRAIRLNNVPFTIVGVADPSFTNLSPGKTQDFFLPLACVNRLRFQWFGPRDMMSDPQTWWVVLLGRLGPGVSISQAQAAATFIFRNEMLHGAKPLSKEADDPAIALTAAPQGLTGERHSFSTLLYVLMSAVGLVLLIACANVAGLLLARSAARQKEMAVRRALGASRWRITRQFLTESVTLSVVGGALGVLVAYWSVQAITSLLSSNADQPFSFVVAPDWRVLAFTILVSVVTGIFFGLAPAFRSTRMDLTPALKESPTSLPAGLPHTGRRLHLGNALVVAQVALSILVLVGAGLLVRTLQNLRDIYPGFDTRNVLLFGIDPTLSGYKDTQSQTLYRDLQDRFTAIPGVVSASYSSVSLLSGNLWTTGIHLPGKPEKSSVDADLLMVGPKFFSTMHIPLLAGRVFTPADFASAKATEAARRSAQQAAEKSASRGAAATRTSAVPGAPIPAIINEAFARQYFAKQNPLGQHLDDSEGKEPGTEPPSAGYQVVGVIGDAKYQDLRREIHPTMYYPLTGGGVHFELRTAANPAALIPIVRDIVNRKDSNLPLSEVRTQSEQIEQLLAQERTIARLSSFFGLLALVLAWVGLYGLLSYEVARRTREIGIRVAVGAQQRDVLRLVVGQGIFLVLVGVVLGAAAAIGVTRFLASLLYNVHPVDLLTFTAVVALLLFATLAACYVPARRAARIDPVVALRNE